MPEPIVVWPSVRPRSAAPRLDPTLVLDRRPQELADELTLLQAPRPIRTAPAWRSLKAAALFAALCASMASQAQPFEWHQFADIATDGSAWSYRTGTVAKGAEWIVAVVQRTTPQTQLTYRAHVRAKHCGAERGDVMLTNMATGETISAGVFVKSEQTLATAIAKTLCAAAARSGASQ